MNRWLDRIFIWTSTFLTGLVTFVVFAQVVTRYVLKVPWPWTQEVTRLGFVTLVFVGAIAGVWQRRHLNVDAVVNALPFALRRVVLLLGQLALLVFFSFVFYEGIGFVQISWTQVTPYLQIPMSYVYLLFPISGAAFIAFALRDALLLARGRIPESGGYEDAAMELDGKEGGLQQ